MLAIQRLLSIIFICFICSSNAQLYKSHDWDDQPTYHSLEGEDEALGSVAIKEKYLIQYYMPVLGSSYKLFETKHSIIRVNSEKGVKRHNRVYIPMRSAKRVVDVKARVLTEDGSIKLLNKNNIKELKNVKGYGNFKIFAIEGVTKNSQLEFIYTVENRISSAGSIVVQKDYKVKEAEVIIRKPNSLTSEIKPYNGFPKFSIEVVDGNKKAYTAVVNEVPAMIDEQSAAPDANRMKVSYVVRGFGSTGMWSNLNRGVQSRYIDFKSKKIKKLIQEYEDYKKTQDPDMHEVNIISNYVNNTFNIIRENNPEFNDFNTILSKKQATEQGIIKVYTAILNHYFINYKLVLTSDRFRHKFDEDFYSSFNLQELLIFFPESGKYLHPSYVNSRLDYAPHEYISNTGIFISKFGYDFYVIEVPNTEYTKTIRNFSLRIDENQHGLVQCQQKLKGYRASNMRGAYKYFKKRDLNRFKGFTAVSGIEDAEFVNFDVKNERVDLITDNVPFEIDWTYTSESMVEEVGNDIIFNIGKVIGKQVEFYQEVTRVNPVELQYPNAYTYHFEIEIPEGYQPSGLEDFLIDEKVTINGAEACLFTSAYSIEGDKIIIEVSEVYNALQMDLEHYDAYKKVVNSAFDFSQKGILFEKI